MNRRVALMLVGCVLPMLLVFALPFIGVRGNAVFLILLVALLGCHLVLMRWAHTGSLRSREVSGGHTHEHH